MSFSTDVKKEISQNELRDCCIKAQLSALIQLCSSMGIGSNGLYLKVITENPATSRRIYSLLKKLYNVSSDILVLKNNKLKKKNIYTLQINEEVRHILLDLSLMNKDGLHEHPSSEIVKKECCTRAYLAGAFMACGSVNSPTSSNYHLEIATIHENHAKYIQKLMNKFDLTAKITTRRQQFVVYIKSSEKISDFLRLIGASNSVMEFEDQRIQRDFLNSFQRLNNCELANEVKTLEACNKQLSDIKVLEDYHRIMNLDFRLQEVINLRKDNKEASLTELCEIYERKTGVVITKSGMKHRFAKIKEIADQYRGS